MAAFSSTTHPLAESAAAIAETGKVCLAEKAFCNNKNSATINLIRVASSHMDLIAGFNHHAVRAQPELGGQLGHLHRVTKESLRDPLDRYAKTQGNPKTRRCANEHKNCS
jgi:hypothetical protein